MSASELHTVQPPCNLFERQIGRDVLPYVRENNLSVFAYGPLCRGLLTGTMQPDTRFTGEDLRQSDPKFQPLRFAQYLNAVQQLDDLAQKKIRKTRDGSCRALGARPARNHRGTVGRALSCRTGSRNGRPRSEPRRGYVRGDRSDFAADDRQSGRSRIHGAAGKKHRLRLGYMELPIKIEFVNNRK